MFKDLDQKESSFVVNYLDPKKQYEQKCIFFPYIETHIIWKNRITWLERDLEDFTRVSPWPRPHTFVVTNYPHNHLSISRSFNYKPKNGDFVGSTLVR